MSGACARPLELATLVDYWFEDAEPAEQERVEEHLMQCEGCSARLRGLVALGEGVRRAAHDLLLTRLEADFKGVSRLDVVSSWEGGLEQRLEDVPVNPDARELILAQPMPALRALGHGVLRMRLVAQEERGERLLGEYTFAHSPTRG